MFKRNWPFIIAGIVVLCLAGFFYYLYSKSPTYNWSQNYNHTSDSPYGNELLYKVIKKLYPDKTFTTIEEPLIYNGKFNDSKSKNDIYFYSGNSFSPDRSTIASLYNFINKGNQVFIASNSISQYFLDSLLNPQKASEYPQNNFLSSVQCMNFNPNLIHPYLKLTKSPTVSFRFFEAIVPMDAGYISEDVIQNQLQNHSYYKIGYIDVSKKERYTNYVKVKVGEGWLHLYTTPMVFSNYYLRQKAVFDYSQKLFVHLEPGNIFWHVNSYANEGVVESKGDRQGSPFGVLLSFSSFRYAWYSFLVAIVLFSIFGFKRRQRPIPVLQKNTNTSVEFAQTITKLYLADGKHKNIAEQKFRYFFNFVRTKFGVNLKASSENEKRRLAAISKVPMENIDRIMFNYTKMESLPDTTAEELNESVKLINEFYQNSR